MFLKKPSLTLPSMAGYQQRLRKGNLMTRNKSVTRSSLNLPALIKHKKLNYCNKEDDISLMFQKLSALYCYLKDPLKELLLQCAFEDQEKCYKLSYFDPFTMDQELPREASCSPQPDHMTPIKRSISNKVAAQHKVFGVYRQDAPLPTVIARWTPKSMSTQYNLQSAIQELSRFGDIDSITPFGRQSVIVIFKDIRSACKAVNAFAPDGPNRSMRCFWHHNFMSKYRRAATFAKTIAPVH